MTNIAPTLSLSSVEVHVAECHLPCSLQMAQHHLCCCPCNNESPSPHTGHETCAQLLSSCSALCKSGAIAHIQQPTAYVRVRRPDRIAAAIPQWQAQGGDYIGVMRVGTEAHSMTTSPWYDPLGILISNKYYMYASGGMYALSSEAARIITSVPLSQRHLSGGGEDTSLGLWILGYNISYLDDRRLAVFPDNGSCPDNFIGKAAASELVYTVLKNILYNRQDCVHVPQGDGP